MQNQAAYDVGQLAQRLVSGFYTHQAALTVATDPRALVLAPRTQPGFLVPVGYVNRLYGTQHVFHFLHYLEEARADAAVASDLERIWLTGSLLSLGDALSQHQYFNRAPELELVRHLRNGVAHGNRFRIDRFQSLVSYPAHNRFAYVRGDKKSEFEITPALNGQPVLFDFMGPADILDVLLSVSLYLIRMGNGDALRPSP